MSRPRVCGSLGRQDSNLGWRDQSPLPYRLATPQCDRPESPRDIASSPVGGNEGHSAPRPRGGAAMFRLSLAASGGSGYIRTLDIWYIIRFPCYLSATFTPL